MNILKRRSVIHSRNSLLVQNAPISGFMKSVWGTFENVKGSILETMAKRMPEKDVKVLAQHWISAEEEKRSKVSSPQPESGKKPSAATPSPTASRKAEVVATQPTTATADSSRFLLHPVFGELVSDLGYKRVYLTSVRNLAFAPVWEKQRILRPERAAAIAAQKIKYGTSNKLPGVITLFHNPKSDQIGILDGQHRASALIILSQRGHWDEWSRNVLVDVFTTSTDEEVSRLFREINSAQPVLLIDMPDGFDEEEASSADAEVVPTTTRAPTSAPTPTPVSTPAPVTTPAPAPTPVNSPSRATEDEVTVEVEVAQSPVPDVATEPVIDIAASTTKPSLAEASPVPALSAGLVEQTAGPVDDSSVTEQILTESAAAEAAVVHAVVDSAAKTEPAKAKAKTSSKALKPSDVKRIITEAVEALAAQHPDMFKPSSRCKPPHLNVDVFRDELFQANLVSRLDIRSTEQLLDVIRQANQQLSAVEEGTWRSTVSGGSGKQFESALKKAQTNQFFLGLGNKSWLYQ